MSEPSIRVHIALDQRLLREVLTDALRREAGLLVVGSSAEGDAGLRACEASRPAVVVVSEPVQENAGQWVARYRAASGGGKVVLLLLADRAVDFGDVGADAAVDAGDGVDELIAAIREVAARR